MNEIKIFFAILLNSITFIIVVGFECIFIFRILSRICKYLFKNNLCYLNLSMVLEYALYDM
jgi:hypothetical protein